MDPLNRTERAFEDLPTTHWTTLLEAASGEADRRQHAEAKLSTLYWRPIYWYFRAHGENHEDAKDLTQGFFATVLLGREMLHKVERREATTFRALLREALKNYRADDYRGKSAKKRRPEGHVFSLEAFDAEPPGLPPEVSRPDDAVSYVLAAELLHLALAAVREGFAHDGMQSHWEAFRARVLDPIVTEADPVACAEICRRWGIESESQVSSMVETVKRRLRKAVLSQARLLVARQASAEEVNREIHELIDFLEQRAR